MKTLLIFGCLRVHDSCGDLIQTIWYINITSYQKDHADASFFFLIDIIFVGWANLTGYIYQQTLKSFSQKSVSSWNSQNVWHVHAFAWKFSCIFFTYVCSYPSANQSLFGDCFKIHNFDMKEKLVNATSSTGAELFLKRHLPHCGKEIPSLHKPRFTELTRGRLSEFASCSRSGTDPTNLVWAGPVG